MLKKIIVSFLILGSIPAQIFASDTGGQKVGHGTWIESKFGTERSKGRDLAERLILGFYQNSSNTPDGSFDARKGARETKEVLEKVAVHSMLHKLVQELVKNKYDEQTYNKMIKIWSGLGFDFVLRGIKYANDTSKKQELGAYLKDNYVPYFAKKASVHWAQFFLSQWLRATLQKTDWGKQIMLIHDISLLLPFFGIELQEAPREILEATYERLLDVSKKVIVKVKSLASKSTPAIA